ncbi:uncharacterized protein LOC144580779 isoform X2 [Callithrix jacchus]
MPCPAASPWSSSKASHAFTDALADTAQFCTWSPGFRVGYAERRGAHPGGRGWSASSHRWCPGEQKGLVWVWPLDCQDGATGRNHYGYGDPESLTLLNLFNDTFHIMSSRRGNARGLATVSPF